MSYLVAMEMHVESTLFQSNVFKQLVDIYTLFYQNAFEDNGG